MTDGYTYRTPLRELLDFTFDNNTNLRDDWFTRPHVLLGGEAPINAIKRLSGLRRVKQILLASIYGVYL